MMLGFPDERLHEQSSTRIGAAGTLIVFSHCWPPDLRTTGNAQIAIPSRTRGSLHRARPPPGSTADRPRTLGRPTRWDTYSRYLTGLFEKLDLTNSILSVHSTGAEKFAAYIGRHSSGRAQGTRLHGVLLDAVPPP